MEELRKEVANFNPGPSKIPKEVLSQAQNELLNYNNHGISVMEMSHRSPEFMELFSSAQKSLIELLSIPENYKVLFMQGGGRGQFAAVPLNLMNRTSSCAADYVVTGSWSANAAKEAEKYGKVQIIHDKLDDYHHVPDVSEWTVNHDASYLYYCCNETVHGVEFSFVPDVGDVPIVADMSSNILSRPIDVSKFGMIFAGAQKNIGCAGVTLVIIREDLIGYAMKECPSVLDYKVTLNANSMFNTPPCYNIYIMGLVFEWLKKQGGIEAMGKMSDAKSKAVYKAIEESSGFYSCPVQKSHRSRMNIPFRINGGDEALEKKFITESVCRKMVGLKGHRSVGGIRVSLYNAVSMDDVERVVTLMKEFHKSNSI